MEHENMQTVRLTFEKLNEHDLNAVGRRLAGSIQVESPAGSMSSGEYQEYLQGLLMAYPDLYFRLHTIIAQGEVVATTWTFEGTHQGPLMSGGQVIPPTGRTISIPGSSLFWLNPGGLVTKQEIYWDRLMLMEQLGLMQLANRGAMGS